jgi:uncharacterized repeat protein (TIGR03803 family)
MRSVKAIFYPNMLSAALLTVAACAAQAKSTEKVLATFKGANGSQPQGVLVSDAAGNLYGTTTAGGKSNDGTVFELIAPAAGKKVWKEKVLASFDGTNGNLPAAGLIMDKSGNLYGTTLEGGASNFGTVFKLAKPAAGKTVWTLSDLFSFDGTDGQNLQSGLIFDSAGNLYGTTNFGGANSDGTVFELSPPASGHGAWTETVLFSFNETDGKFVADALIFDTKGNLYGTTNEGGASGDGTVFELSPPASGSAWTETVLASFDGANGENPYAGLVADSSGNLYGTTAKGGTQGDGTVFRLSPPSGGGTAWVETVLLNFKGSNGDYPFAGLALGSGDDLYGVTGGGGKFGYGVAFKLAPPAGGKGAWTETVLAAFDKTDGEGPSAALILGKTGDLYGTNVAGGKSGDGNVFQLTP